MGNIRDNLGGNVGCNILLGCIADDFTGATDLANNLVRAGMRTIQTIGIPADAAALEADAMVVALKSRTVPADEAVSQSLAACRWLLSRGRQASSGQKLVSPFHWFLFSIDKWPRMACGSPAALRSPHSWLEMK